ncbi:MAG: hypothetical protein U1F15_06325 [Burkholderiales bacterium]
MIRTLVSTPPRHWRRMLAVAAIGALACGPAAPQGKVGRPPRAEIQAGLCAPPDDIVRALVLAPREAPYQTWQFDDASLTLLGLGVRIRLRVRPDGSQLTVKVAGQVCATAAPPQVRRREGKCEYDVYAGQRNGAVSLERALDAVETRDVLAGRTPVANVLSPAQVAYLRDIAHAFPLPAALRPLGPIDNRVYSTPDRKYDVDLSQLPGGERYAEISTRVPVPAIDEGLRAMDARLAQAGVAKCADQAGQAAAKLRLLVERN